MSERGSWLELSPEETEGNESPFTSFTSFCLLLKTSGAWAAAKTRAWWRDTTDVVVLNSPWLRRGTGRLFRCICVLGHTSVWVWELYFNWELYFHNPFCKTCSGTNFSQLATLALLCAMTICLGATLWISCQTSRESFRATLLFAVGMIISFALLSVLRGRLWIEASFMVAFVVMCHCNVHPTVLLLPICYQLKVFFLDYHVLTDPEWEHPLWLHVLMSELTLLVAFACDFSLRVKAVCEGVLFGENDDLLQSPVAGRSCRNLCWVPATNQWIWWIFFIIQTHNRSIQDPDAAYLQNHLPVSSLLVPSLAAGLVLFSMSNWRTQPRFSYLTLRDWYDDLVFAFFCCAPAMLFAVNFNISGSRMEAERPSLRWYHYAAIAEQESTVLFAASAQTLVQAGCHPAICVVASIAMTAAAWGMPSNIVDFHYIVAVLAWALQASHIVDFFSRMRAIQTGMRASRQNAESSMMFVSSTSLHGLELRAIRDEEAPAPAKSPSRRRRAALVAVVRHAERADNAQSFDGWGTSKDAADFPHDPPITALGVKQAQQLGDELLAEDMDFDVIVSSPFLRCLQTALILAEKFDATVLIDEELGEVMGPSVFETEPPLPPRQWSDLKTILQESAPSADFHGRLRAGRFMGKRPQWAETLQQARLRYVKRYLDYLRRSRRTRKSCLLVTHGYMVQACATVLPANQYRRVSSVDYCGAAVASCYKLAERTREDHDTFFPAKGDSFEDENPAGSSADLGEPSGSQSAQLLEGAKVRYWELWMRGVRTLPSSTPASLQNLGQSWEDIEKLLGVLPPVAPAPSAAGSHSESVCSFGTRTSTTISMNMIRQPDAVPASPKEEHKEKSKREEKQPENHENPPVAAPKLTLSMSRLAARRMNKATMPATVEEDQV